MERIDSMRKCEVEGCNNLGDVNKVVNGKVYRRKICCKHRKKMYGLVNKSRNKRKIYERFKDRGHCDKCIICGWEGPCDVHRIIPQGKYNMSNMMSSCPNCHRLIHRGLLVCVGGKWERVKSLDLS